MSREVGELFGEGKGAPRPRLRLVAILMVSGLVLALGGLACSAVPGGLVVLVAWLVAEKERDRVDSGFLPESDRPRVALVRRLAQAGLVLVIGLLLVQCLLMWGGVYEAIWTRALKAAVDLLV